MIDILFYEKANQLREGFEQGKKFEKEDVLGLLESYRSNEPIVYNIETTNACNMQCKMCPRTTMMNRAVETITKETFSSVVDQLRPFTDEEWCNWEKFVQNTYNIFSEEMSENHFFLYVIPKVIQLHGYGDPLLDKNMHEYIEILRNRGFESYFSCNPANIDIEKTKLMFENGLNYIKYSIESVDDEKHKKIRGSASNFTKSYNDIVKLLELKKKHNYTTNIIITMLDLNNEGQEEEFDKLKAAFKDLDVYIYKKSEDQQWYREEYHKTKSIHWSEFCKHPWMSMTIKSNGEFAMCMEDFNNDIIFGNANTQSLSSIWNGKKYKKFRADHFNLTPNIKCSEECDMKLIGEYFD